jgi:predicted alpha-1,6-mannanase (GH76 family)
MIFSLILTFLLASIQVSWASSQAELQTNAIAATNTLLQWYNHTNGLFQTTEWWNSANAITTLALLTQANPQLETATRQIWSNTFEKAQKFNLHQTRDSPNSIGLSSASTPGRREGRVRSFTKEITYYQRPVRSLRALEKRSVLEEDIQDPKGFLNGFYDDEGWWALAWIKVYDVIGGKQHLDVARDIFDDMVATGYNASCGGIWWNRKRSYNSAISNELFLSVAAHLATRVENSDYYTTWAKKQWTWFEQSGLINADYNINDGLEKETCKNNKGVVWSYNQGVILGALVELSKVDKKNATVYLEPAKKIAAAALHKLADDDGILHDPHEPDLGNDGNQFKGVFARNLRQLYDATQEQWMKKFLMANADAVWNGARKGSTNLLGPVWSGPYFQATAATQSSALDVLVAAAAVA